MIVKKKLFLRMVIK